jgi:hypothetical protein
MKRAFAVALFAAVALSAAGAADTPAKVKPKSGIDGVKGTVYIIDGNKNKDTKLTVQAHDVIVIEFTYPVNPPLPKSAHQKSSDPDVVKAVGVQRVINVKGPIGVGRLGASFIAEKKGKATLTLDISHLEDIKITCEVEVK